ncbi:MAG: MMPL family transporter [Tepidisphaeraceae bacterium]|jgi:predicted exporter
MTNTATVSLAQRQQWTVICIVVAVAISAAGWMRLRLDNSLETLLPQNSPARQTILFLRDSSFATKAVLWFRLRGNGNVSDLYAAADETEKRLDPQLIKRVIHPPEAANALDEAMGLLDDAGELLNERDLSDIQAATAPDALRKRMRECFMQLVEPQGGFMTQIMRRDPLGVSERILSRMLALTNGLGYRVQVKDGRLLHEDGRQLMLVLETSASATSLVSSKALADHLNRLAAAAPAGVEIIPLCGQIHTEQNDELMERDFRLAGAINTVAFVLLFFLVSRDFRVAAVFLLPLVTTAITIGWCALVYPNLSTMMIALAVTMAGSAVDYGIYVYTAVSMGRDPKADVRRIFRPLIISHLTTLGVFVAFLFSKIPAFRQLGCMTSISLVMSLLAAIFILPGMIRPGGKLVLLGRGMPLRRWGGKMVPLTILGVAVFAAAAFVARKTGIDSDVTRLDGVTATVKQNEHDFQAAWGRSDKEMAILVVTGKTRAEAEAANEEVGRIVAPKFAEGSFVTLSSFWPSEATRHENGERWQAFWSPQRIADLRRNLAAAGQPYGFSAEAFEPFFQSLANPPRQDLSRQIVQSIEDQFIARSNGDWQMLSYFEDSPQNVSMVRKLIAGRADAQVVSRVALGQAFAETAVSESKVLVAVSVAFIVVSLLLLTRSVGKSIIIMLPAVTGVVAMLAVLTLMSLAINVVSVVAAILVLALGSDYGVFSEYAWDGREPILGQGMASVLLSFLTTLAGAGAMLLALHPALHLAGVSMTSGLVAAYLTAFIMIPGINFLRDSWRGRAEA